MNDSELAATSEPHLPAVLVDPAMNSEELRSALYAGNIVIRTTLPSVSLLVEHARSSLNDLFGGADPEMIHQQLSPAELNELLVEWKPRFIHNPVSIELANSIVAEAGFARDATFADVPKPRTAFPVGHLVKGIAAGFPWHRDTWYAAPPQQINWWLPVFRPRVDNAMAFDLTGFGTNVENNSAEFDYYRRNQERGNIAKLAENDNRSQPGAMGWKSQSPLVLLPDPGSVILFAGAHLHRTIPNTSGWSRYSIDFRTIDASDVVAKSGAPCIDNRSTGTAIRDFRRLDDRSLLPDSVVLAIEPDGPPVGAELVFQPKI